MECESTSDHLGAYARPRKTQGFRVFHLCRVWFSFRGFRNAPGLVAEVVEILMETRQVVAQLALEVHGESVQMARQQPPVERQHQPLGEPVVLVTDHPDGPVDVHVQHVGHGRHGDQSAGVQRYRGRVPPGPDGDVHATAVRVVAGRGVHRRPQPQLVRHRFRVTG